MHFQLDQFKPSPTGHSSTVRMSLLVGSAVFPVFQSGEDEIKCYQSDAVPLGDAILETIVDDRVHRRAIRITSTHPRPNWLSIIDR